MGGGGALPAELQEVLLKSSPPPPVQSNASKLISTLGGKGLKRPHPKVEERPRLYVLHPSLTQADRIPFAGPQGRFPLGHVSISSLLEP